MRLDNLRKSDDRGRLVSETYLAYALRLRSSRPIPGLLIGPATSGGDVEVRLEAGQSWPEASLERPRQLRYASANRDEHGEPRLTVWTLSDGTLFHLRYGDGIEFAVDRDGTE